MTVSKFFYKIRHLRKPNKLTVIAEHDVLYHGCTEKFIDDCDPTLVPARDKIMDMEMEGYCFFHDDDLYIFLGAASWSELLSV